MRSLFFLAPFVLATGCLAQEPPLADVLVTWDATTLSWLPASVETHIGIYNTATEDQLDGAYAPGYAGDIALTIDPQPEPVRVCVQLWAWAEDDRPLPWCDAPCLEQYKYGPEHCQEVVVEDDVQLTFTISEDSPPSRDRDLRMPTI